MSSCRACMWMGHSVLLAPVRAGVILRGRIVVSEHDSTAEDGEEQGAHCAAHVVSSAFAVLPASIIQGLLSAWHPGRGEVHHACLPAHGGTSRAAPTPCILPTTAPFDLRWHHREPGLLPAREEGRGQSPVCTAVGRDRRATRWTCRLGAVLCGVVWSERTRRWCERAGACACECVCGAG